MKRFHIFVCLVVILLSLFVFIACNDSYSLTVENGTGGGSYAKGTSVTATAIIPNNMQFVKWTKDGYDFSLSNPVTFTINENVSLKAVFENKYTTGLRFETNGNTVGYRL